ncbi:pirin family protein [Allosaccharopolyspora coralli]|uniref:Pirin family protein n=1 Tax=Allosaccharopolyspora coralli TaxID=2665642 RepID=A0A5Q3QI77_9PSEU|nr:pirin family protein [Allosaccharopolyspora coralli]QGK70547.1 pirin family protein [Allosaccharopolyspora coralli]
MSNVELSPDERTLCRGSEATPTGPEVELLAPREVPLGGPRAMLVQRSLPNRDRRMVGAWCFADCFGPDDLSGGPGMQVPPHPHIGLQTVTWLVDGDVRHRDSLGSDQFVRPGELNLMTAGRGIAHSERTPETAGSLHGVQLWVAMPDEDRTGEPHFEHHRDLPRLEFGDVRGTVLMGEVDGAVSSARSHSPLVGAEFVLPAGGSTVLPLEPDFEHAVLTLSGRLTAAGAGVPAATMLYLGLGRREAPVHAETESRFLLLGGVPFEEDLVMWWNFVGRSHDEIVTAREEWEGGRARNGDSGPFGAVPGDSEASLPAPALPQAELRPRSRVRRRS